MCKLLLTIMLGMTLIANAKDFGALGTTYPIIEDNFLEFIQAKASKIDVEALKKETSRVAKQKADRPDVVHNITAAIKNNTYYFDPSLYVSRDIVNHKGVLVAKAGTTLNPLKTVDLSEELLFINADSSKELEYAKNILDSRESNQKPVKVILISGSVDNSIEKLNYRVYFDQQAKITTKLNIKHSPAIVTQAQDKLKIVEVAL